MVWLMTRAKVSVWQPTGNEKGYQPLKSMAELSNSGIEG